MICSLDSLKTDALFQTNTNVMSVLNNANNSQSYQLNSFPGLNVTGSAGNNNHHHNSNSTSLNSSNDQKHRNSSASHLNNNVSSSHLTLVHLDRSSLTPESSRLNSQNFSNSSSWNANDDDLDDFDAELNLKSGSTGGNSNKRHLNSEFDQMTIRPVVSVLGF